MAVGRNKSVDVSRNYRVQNTSVNKRILHKIDSESKSSSYLNQTLNKNKSRVSRVINGMSNIDDLGFLQVYGVNKLEKEIKETRNIKGKTFDRYALHRNELTGEEEHGKTTTEDDQ
jgi:hypothetical protein